MKFKNIIIAALLFAGCAQAQKEPIPVIEKPTRSLQHEYGGWYCPDNLFGFPAVDLQDWDKVPAISGRLPTEEETRSGQSLIFVDQIKHPDAFALDIKLPRLARYYTENSKKNELVIIIQAINVSGDKIVGFRYLNGGNGSAYLDQVSLLSADEVAALTPQKFVAIETAINAHEDKVWEVITDSKYKADFEPILNKAGNLEIDWRVKSNHNYYYQKRDIPTSAYKDKLFGCWYLQNDFKIQDLGYVEKVLLVKDETTNGTKLKALFGPYAEDFDIQSSMITAWSEKVKLLSEK